MLAWNRFPGYYPTMLGTVVALFVNYGFNATFHKKIIDRHAGPALTMCITMMGAAVLMGILTSSIGADGKVLPSKLIELQPDAIPSVMRCLANLISTALPAVLGKHLHLLLCALSVPCMSGASRSCVCYSPFSLDLFHFKNEKYMIKGLSLCDMPLLDCSYL